MFQLMVADNKDHIDYIRQKLACGQCLSEFCNDHARSFCRAIEGVPSNLRASW